MHVYPTTPPMYRVVHRVAKAIVSSHPAISHCSLLFDGHVVWGSRNPGMDMLYKYMRIHAYHQVNKLYAPADTRSGSSRFRYARPRVGEQGDDFCCVSAY